MKRVKFNSRDILVTAVLAVFAFSLSSLTMAVALIAFLVYMLVRVQFTASTKDSTSAHSLNIPPPEPSTKAPRNERATKPLELLLSELAEAKARETETFKDFRHYGNAWYEKQWVKAMQEFQRLMDELSGRMRNH